MKNNMTKNLFVYGCSFTEGKECNIEHEYGKKYKKSDDDLSWPEIISKEKNLKLHNYGIGLNSNDKIFYSILDTFDLINEGDTVIIEMSFHYRYDIPNLDDDRLITITPNPEQLLNGLHRTDDRLYNKDDISHLTYMSVLMDSDLFRERNEKRFQFIKNILMNYKKTKDCIIWNLEPTCYEYETINSATNSEIEDAHWSFNGNRDFAKDMINNIK